MLLTDSGRQAAQAHAFSFKTLKQPRTRAKRLDIPPAASETAAFMGTERNDASVADIVFFQQGEKRHGHGSPPVGKTNEYDIIFFQIWDFRGNLRPGIAFLFPLRLLHQRVIIRGIGNNGFMSYPSFTRIDTVSCLHRFHIGI